MTNFGQICPKMVPMAIFESRIMAENEIFGDFQYESLKSPYMMAIFKQKTNFAIFVNMGNPVDPPPYHLKYNNYSDNIVKIYLNI